MAGQINLGSELGNIILNYARDEKYISYLEVGTWNGQGSTRCFIEGLKDRDNECVFISLEACPNFYKEATNYCKEFLNDRIQLVHGRIVENDELIDGNKPIHERFLAGDLANYATCPNVWEDIKDRTFDVVLLDGGEFSTYAEFKKLEPLSKVLILDDSKMLKNQQVVKDLNSNPKWRLVKSSNGRNGFAIYEKN